MQHTQEDLLNKAAVIRDETVPLANTAERVGTMHEETVVALFENVTYTDPTPTEQSVGRVPAGTNLAGRNLLSIVMDMLKAPLKAAAVSLGGGGLFEKGLVGGVDVALAGSIIPNNDTIAARRLRRTQGGVTTIIQVPASNSVAYTDADVATPASYVLEADTTGGATKASSPVNVAFVAPTYYGTVASLTPTEAQVKALAKQVWPAAQRTLPFTNNDQRVALFEPKVFGRRLLIKNQNGYDVTGTFTYSEVLFTLPDGSQELYAGYVLTNPAGNGAAFTYIFYQA